MAIRKLIALLTLSILITPMAPTQAAMKITPGTKCSKAGLTQLYSGKNYSCIKLGKNLYWNNGVKVPSDISSLRNLPATCKVESLQWVKISEIGISNTDGQVMLAASVFNSSLSNVASDVKIYLEWYDNIGLNFKKTIKIPRIYPVQTLNFGDVSNFSLSSKDFPGPPVDVKLRSTCTSIPLNKQDLINGNFPILSGQAPVVTTKSSFDNDVTTDVNASFVVKNIFKKDLIISWEVYPESKNKVHLFGIFKDKFGNIIGGYNEYVRGDLNTLEPGDSSRVDLNLLSFSNVQNDLIDRISVFDYTIIID
jgi:hypothetical protein